MKDAWLAEGSAVKDAGEKKVRQTPRSRLAPNGPSRFRSAVSLESEDCSRFPSESRADLTAFTMAAACWTTSMVASIRVGDGVK